MVTDFIVSYLLRLFDYLFGQFCLQARASTQMPSFDISSRDSFISTLIKCTNLTELLHWTLTNGMFSLNSCDISMVCFVDLLD